MNAHDLSDPLVKKEKELIEESHKSRHEINQITKSKTSAADYRIHKSESASRIHQERTGFPLKYTAGEGVIGEQRTKGRKNEENQEEGERHQ
ncbi:hypothetical protein SpCBS45565_g01621 [Spizellomyces sp. 'palustris']|nr:hypothetical protein SpCBS45565_g01621 [Spizellomyces sp. 'palustris']